MDDKKNKILIIDDDFPTREMYAEIFKGAGYEVSEAEDGAAGLEKAAQEIPGVIFTGIKMPKMDGFALMEELKKNESTAKIPVVISSHLGKEEDQKRAKELGAKDFIVRDTTSPKEVLRKINSLFLPEGSLSFDPHSMDAPGIAKELGFNPDYQCPKCGERMVVKIKLHDGQQGDFEASFACPKCSWSFGK